MGNEVVWEYLESLPEQTATWSEWVNHLGQWEKFSVFYKNYLQVEMTRATSVECLILCEHNCPREVVERSPHDIRAVCPRRKTGAYRLELSDILLHSLNQTSLNQALCEAMELEVYFGDTWMLDNAWRLGEYSFKENGVKCPVCLTIPSGPEKMADMVEHLCNLHQEPFILLAPTGRNLPATAARTLSNHNSVFLALSEAFTLQDDGTFRFEAGE
jgi:hypothetical protein